MLPQASIVLNLIVEHHIEHLERIFRQQFKVLLYVEHEAPGQAVPFYRTAFPANDHLDVQILKLVGQVLEGEIRLIDLRESLFILLKVGRHPCSRLFDAYPTASGSLVDSDCLTEEAILSLSALFAISITVLKQSLFLLLVAQIEGDERLLRMPGLSPRVRWPGLPRIGRPRFLLVQSR